MKKMRLRPVVVGNWVGQDWVVLSGLKAGEKVAIDNIIKLRPGALVSPHAKDQTPATASKSAK
jgi:membrane fusion protein (multidrug efflux system)